MNSKSSTHFPRRMYKALKSVAHNYGHSITSLMSHFCFDYFLGHILKEARKTNINRLEIDILENSAEPREIVNFSARKIIDYNYEYFPKLVESCGSSIEIIRSAKMILEFDLLKTRLTFIMKSL